MASKKMSSVAPFVKNKLPLFFKIILSLSMLILTGLILMQYFQQDEWHSFGLIQSYGTRYITLDKPLWEIIFSDRVGARAITYMLFNLFGVSSLFFAIFAVSLHYLNSFLVFFLAKKMTKNKIVSVVSALFFLFNSLGHQAYSWFGTMAGTATSVTFVLLSVIFYFSFMESKKSKDLFLSLFFIFISFLFKESGFFVFALFPLTWFLYEQKFRIKDFFIKNWPVIFYGIIMAIILAKSIIFIPGVRANYVSANTSGYAKLATHFLLYPFEAAGQSFIPYEFVFETSRRVTRIFDPSLSPDTPEFDLFYTTKATEAVAIVLSVLLIGLMIFAYRKILKNDRPLSKFFIFSFAFLVLSFLPYVVLDKFDAYLDSRYYYLGLVGSCFILALLLDFALSYLKNPFLKKLIISFIGAVFLSHVFFLFSDLISLAKVSIERRNIIAQIEKIVPNLQKKTVFYVTSSSPGYYGIPELKVPFQTGLGQVLLTLYGVRDTGVKSLFKEDTLGHTGDEGFLYDTVAQGYKEEGGRGFGYYYSKEELSKDIMLKKFDKNNVIYLFYNPDIGEIIK